MHRRRRKFGGAFRLPRLSHAQKHETPTVGAVGASKVRMTKVVGYQLIPAHKMQFARANCNARISSRPAVKGPPICSMLR
jgi:hypothetical protein